MGPFQPPAQNWHNSTFMFCFEHMLEDFDEIKTLANLGATNGKKKKNLRDIVSTVVF
jgi:hypothetical protein